MLNNAYLESQILTADSIGLVQILYQGSIQAVRDARRHLADKDIRARSAAISKAMSFLNELASSLDHSTGGEIATNLAQLYRYMQDRLLQANLHQADEPLVETLGLLTTLDQAWQTIGHNPESPADNASSSQEQSAIRSTTPWCDQIFEDAAVTHHATQSWSL